MREHFSTTAPGASSAGIGGLSTGTPSIGLSRVQGAISSGIQPVAGVYQKGLTQASGTVDNPITIVVAPEVDVDDIRQQNYDTNTQFLEDTYNTDVKDAVVNFGESLLYLDPNSSGLNDALVEIGNVLTTTNYTLLNAYYNFKNNQFNIVVRYTYPTYIDAEGQFKPAGNISSLIPLTPSVISATTGGAVVDSNVITYSNIYDKSYLEKQLQQYEQRYGDIFNQDQQANGNGGQPSIEEDRNLIPEPYQPPSKLHDLKTSDEVQKDINTECSCSYSSTKCLFMTFVFFLLLVCLIIAIMY